MALLPEDAPTRQHPQGFGVLGCSARQHLLSQHLKLPHCCNLSLQSTLYKEPGSPPIPPAHTNEVCKKRETNFIGHRPSFERKF